MNRTEARGSATIIPFPVRPRADGAHLRNAEPELPMVEVASAGGWYHDAAMREDDKAGTH